MRATGVVRRIDDLGRIVIPKEIRRTMRMREGDPLEIFTGQGGEIIFKKYSMMAELSAACQNYADSLYKVSGFNCVIYDNDKVVAYTGNGKKDVINTPMPREIEKIQKGRTSYFKGGGDMGIMPFMSSDSVILGAVPVINSGDVMGAVALVGKEGENLNEGDRKLLSLTGFFLSNHTEI